MTLCVCFVLLSRKHENFTKTKIIKKNSFLFLIIIFVIIIILLLFFYFNRAKRLKQ